MLPFYNTRIAFVPYKKFWLSLVNIEKTSFMYVAEDQLNARRLIWLLLFIGISSNMLSFSLFYPFWRFNMKISFFSFFFNNGSFIVCTAWILTSTNAKECTFTFLSW